MSSDHALAQYTWEGFIWNSAAVVESGFSFEDPGISRKGREGLGLEGCLGRQQECGRTCETNCLSHRYP
jgi:hypothetical protein